MMLTPLLPRHAAADVYAFDAAMSRHACRIAILRAAPRMSLREPLRRRRRRVTTLPEIYAAPSDDASLFIRCRASVMRLRVTLMRQRIRRADAR